MIIFLIILGYVVGIFVFAAAFNVFFEPAYPPSGKRDRFRHKVKSITINLSAEDNVLEKAAKMYKLKFKKLENGTISASWN